MHNTNTIALLTPIRKRPDQYRDLIKSWELTTTGLSTFIFGIDDDDKSYENILDPRFHYEYHKRIQFLTFLNYLALKYYKSYKYIAFIEDDVRFVSSNWEQKILDILSDKSIHVVYCDDEINKENLIGLPFMTSNIIEVLGYMVAPELQTLWGDHYWTKVFKGAGIVTYRPDIVIAHRHYSNPRSNYKADEITRELEHVAINQCGPAFQKLGGRIQTDIMKLRDFYAH